MIKKINLLIIVLFFLVSCGGLDDAGKTLRNEKIRNTDEFLVKKRNPLSLPPEYDTMPKPGTTKDNRNNEDSIKSILNMSKEQKKTRQSSSSVENSIINKIGK